jgi:uncharacterized protein (DUF983 family)
MTDYPGATPCPRCGEPRVYEGFPNSCIIRCDRCANDPAVILAWAKKKIADADATDAVTQPRS